ncbi:unnamed protein product [Nesidiocoris tenuis]|uniref:Uncharacterized protein n=1 Tax=Nesidiocoris tenuis TaxID=355587 RepID=A0A6H5H883_9HEMI|nr:unnamed protein product [Nesidiocoris tenuis]
MKNGNDSIKYGPSVLLCYNGVREIAKSKLGKPRSWRRLPSQVPTSLYERSMIKGKLPIMRHYKLFGSKMAITMRMLCQNRPRAVIEALGRWPSHIDSAFYLPGGLQLRGYPSIAMPTSWFRSVRNLSHASLCLNEVFGLDFWVLKGDSMGCPSQCKPCCCNRMRDLSTSKAQPFSALSGWPGAPACATSQAENSRSPPFRRSQESRFRVPESPERALSMGAENTTISVRKILLVISAFRKEDFHRRLDRRDCESKVKFKDSNKMSSNSYVYAKHKDFTFCMAIAVFISTSLPMTTTTSMFHQPYHPTSSRFFMHIYPCMERHCCMTQKHQCLPWGANGLHKLENALMLPACSPLKVCQSNAAEQAEGFREIESHLGQEPSVPPPCRISHSVFLQSHSTSESRINERYSQTSLRRSGKTSQNFGPIMLGAKFYGKPIHNFVKYPPPVSTPSSIEIAQVSDFSGTQAFTNADRT